MVEDLVGPLIGHDLRVGDLHAERHAFLLCVAFDTTEDRDGVVSGLFACHAASLPWHRDEIGTTRSGARVDAGVESRLELVMQFLADQTVLKRRARTGHHRGRQAVLLEDRHLLGSGKVNSLEADPRQDLAALLEREF